MTSLDLGRLKRRLRSESFLVSHVFWGGLTPEHVVAWPVRSEAVCLSILSTGCGVCWCGGGFGLVCVLGELGADIWAG